MTLKQFVKKEVKRLEEFESELKQCKTKSEKRRALGETMAYVYLDQTRYEKRYNENVDNIVDGILNKMLSMIK